LEGWQTDHEGGAVGRIGICTDKVYEGTCVFTHDSGYTGPLLVNARVSNFESWRLQVRIVVISRSFSSNIRDKIERLYSNVPISSFKREHVIARRVRDGRSKMFEHDSVLHSLGCFRTC
jgi:hypothetical protein